MPEALLKVAGVSKAYAGNMAIQDLDLTLEGGRIHALVGENGAGKSTLVKVISGGIRCDSGAMWYDGINYQPSSPIDAQRRGIVAVQQELSLSPFLPAYQNLWLGHKKPRGRLLIRTGDLRKQTKEICNLFDVHLDLNQWVCDLSLEDQQVVEILKALAFNPRVIILDEPTSALGATNTRWLLGLIRKLKNEGRAILFISHRLAEVLEIADDITVLKDGRKMRSVPRNTVNESDVIRMMVGRDLEDIFPRKFDRALLDSLEDLLVVDRLYAEGVHNVSFKVKRGEVVGLAGLEGQGQHELLLTLFGLKPMLNGSIKLANGGVLARSPTASIRRGVGFVPVDRRTEGVILPLSVRENITMATLNRRSRFGWVNSRLEQALVRDTIEDLAIRTPGQETPVESLSGGNQQKVALGKWLVANPRVLLLDDPTRGVDIEARRDIYHRIRKLGSLGVGILLNSTDTIELVGMCDRVLVMYEGQIAGELTGAEISEESIVSAAVGLKDV